MNSEKERVIHCLDARIEVKITNGVEKEMIANQMLRLVYKENSGLDYMLYNDKYEDLGTMYKLFSWVRDGVSTINKAMTSHFEKRRNRVLTDPDMFINPMVLVQRLLDETAKYDCIISMALTMTKHLRWI